MATKEDALRTLLKWKSSLEDYGKIDSWSKEKDYSILSRFILSDEPKKQKEAVRRCRDYSLLPDHDTNHLHILVSKACAFLEGRLMRTHRRTDLVGQAKKYKGPTNKLFNEKLRFMNGEHLRNVDIEIEDKSISRMVRRIVEKRMCQAYHRQNRNMYNDDNRKRYYMKRATSFQLYNIGQVENVRFVERGKNTHWKRVYDANTGSIVFKKKTSYSSYDKAMEGLRIYLTKHPEDRPLMKIYVCTHCGKYHIGHNYIETNTDNQNDYPVHNAPCSQTFAESC